VKHSSWETNSDSVRQEIKCFLSKPKLHYRVYSNLPLDPVCSHIKPVYIFISYLLKIRFNISLSHLRSGLESGLFLSRSSITRLLWWIFRTYFLGVHALFPWHTPIVEEFACSEQRGLVVITFHSCSGSPRSKLGPESGHIDRGFHVFSQSLQIYARTSEPESLLT
jgi:hypothetical protein